MDGTSCDSGGVGVVGNVAGSTTCATTATTAAAATTGAGTAAVESDRRQYIYLVFFTPVKLVRPSPPPPNLTSCPFDRP